MPVIMDDNAPIQERRKVVKSCKNVLPQKQTVVVIADEYGVIYLKKCHKIE